MEALASRACALLSVALTPESAPESAGGPVTVHTVLGPAPEFLLQMKITCVFACVTSSQMLLALLAQGLEGTRKPHTGHLCQNTSPTLPATTGDLRRIEIY